MEGRASVWAGTGGTGLTAALQSPLPEPLSGGFDRHVEQFSSCAFPDGQAQLQGRGHATPVSSACDPRRHCRRGPGSSGSRGSQPAHSSVLPLTPAATSKLVSTPLGGQHCPQWSLGTTGTHCSASGAQARLPRPGRLRRRADLASPGICSLLLGTAPPSRPQVLCLPCPAREHRPQGSPPARPQPRDPGRWAFPAPPLAAGPTWPRATTRLPGSASSSRAGCVTEGPPRPSAALVGDPPRPLAIPGSRAGCMRPSAGRVLLTALPTAAARAGP